MENSLSLYLDQCSQVYYDLPIFLVSCRIFQMNSLSPSILKNITRFNKETKTISKNAQQQKTTLRSQFKKCHIPKTARIW